MQDTNYKRLRSSWLLLLVYVPMLLAVTLHRHDGVQQADDAFYCEDCAVLRVAPCGRSPLYAPRPRCQPSPSTSLLCLWTVTAVAATFSQPFVVVYSGRGALSCLLSESSLAAPQALLSVRDG